MEGRFGSGKESKIGEFKKLLFHEKPDVVALQETKCASVDNKWNTEEFIAEQSVIEEFFIAIKGKWKGRDDESIIVNVYGPHKDTNKVKMWASLEKFVGDYDVAWILCGDFNEVREQSERQNCDFIERRVIWFNEFINKSSLIEVPLGGKRFTRICDNGIKFSKLDRFLISEKTNHLWEELSALVLERKLSDHCPIVLRDRVIDFDPKPTKVFDEWLEAKGCEQVIKEAWSKKIEGRRPDCIFRNKLKNVKYALKEWSFKTMGKIDIKIEELKAAATEWEATAEVRNITEDERSIWLDTRRKWLEREKTKSNMAKQKARVKWIVEGEENSKFFHSVIKRRLSKQNIRGLNINGVWSEDPMDVK
ncbi:uncharacterized protein [Rutidosis leptorrhynchoides]|uniref:uncharacterized protein n=1 Tax=Rutidosis leptorrhynchoides TaxID=125765 RepID=UPI003A99CB2D